MGKAVAMNFSIRRLSNGTLRYRYIQGQKHSGKSPDQGWGVQTPVEVSHDGVSLQNPAYQIKPLGGDASVFMEATGRY